jgi:hypothetical protein
MKPPLILDALVAAVNAEDVDSFLALFAEDGRIDDLGRSYQRHEDIRRWTETELLAFHARLKPLNTSGDEHSAAMTADILRDGLIASRSFVLTLHDGLITVMTVTG